MQNLSDDQIRNLKKDGYEIVERGGKTEIVKKTPSGLVRYKMEDGKVKQVDSYFGNVRDDDDHDRRTLNLKTGDLSGHGYKHADKF